MVKKVIQVLEYLSVCTIVLLFCANPQNPFGDPSKAKISLVFKDSKGRAGADLAVSDTVGNIVQIGICPYLSGYIDSVIVTILRYRNNADSVYTLKKFSSDADTQWNTFTFTTIGIWNVSVKAIILGGNSYAANGDITIYGKPVSASIQPGTETRIVDSIAAFTVSAIGDAPLTYQWFHDTAALAGETGVSFIKSHITFSDSGKYACVVRDKWGDSGFTVTPSILTVTPKNIIKTNAKPTISVSGHATILSFEVCSLTVSASDPDSGDSLTFAVMKAPLGYTFSSNLFAWAPYNGYLGSDSMKIDTAIFTVIDNGKPPLSDTQKVLIVVSAKIFPPDTVKGIAGVSRYNGSFVFKWNKSANADEYAIYRSKDTTRFTQYATTQDTSFTNNIKDTAFYYYVIATNSKKSSPPSLRVRSTDINTAPKWSHAATNVTINEGSSFSFDCADSCKDANGDDVAFQLTSSGSVNDSLIGTTWKYTPSYSDSGVKTVKIKATDGIDSSFLTLTVHVVNVPRPPQPQPQSLSTKRNAALQITLTAFDSDGDSVTSWAIDTPSAHGTVVLTSASKPAVTYTPTAGNIGTDYFTFKAFVGNLSSTYSAKVSINVDTNNIAPKISQKLTAQTLNKGDSLRLIITVNADAFPAPTYYWYKDGAMRDSTMTNSWKKAQLALADSGLYYVIVKNVAGQDSSGARVIVRAPPSGLTYAVNPAIYWTGLAVSSNAATVTGDVDSFTVLPALPAGLALNKTTGAISGTPTASVSATAYTVTAKNQAGTITASLTITVNGPPTITTQPQSKSANKGGSVTLSVATTSTGLKYVWYQKKNSTAKCTTQTYTLTALAYSDSGQYFVVVSNIAGSVSSDTTSKVTVMDNVAPSISLKGSLDTTILLNPSGTYSDPGVLSAIDDRDGNILGSANVTSAPVNLGTCGKYTVTWQDSDLTGNKSTATRVVKVMGWVAAPDIDVYAFQAVQTNDDNLYIGYNEPQFNNVFVNKYIENTNSWQQVGGQIGTGNVKMTVSWDKTTPCIAVLGSGNIISVKKLNGTVWNSVNGACEVAPSWTFYSDLKMFSDGMPYIAMTAFHTMVLSVFKSDPSTQCWVGPYAQNNDYGIYSATPVLDMNSLGQVYTIATSSSGNIVAFHDSLYWHQVGVNSIDGSAALSKIILDESPTPIPYIYGKDSVDYKSPMAWKLGGSGGWTSLGRVKDGDTKQDCFSYSPSTKKFYAGYVDNVSGQIDSCFVKEYSNGAWQPFPALTKGKIPVDSPTYSTSMFVFVGQYNYYVVYQKTGGKVGVLRYQVVQ